MTTPSRPSKIVHARVHNLAAPRRSGRMKRRKSALELPSAPLVAELRSLIEASRANAARSLNSELVWLYWQVACPSYTLVLVGAEPSSNGGQLRAP